MKEEKLFDKIIICPHCKKKIGLNITEIELDEEGVPIL